MTLPFPLLIRRILGVALALVFQIPAPLLGQESPGTLGGKQAVELPEVRVTERGPHHRVDEYTTTLTNEDGRILVSTNRYVALETGMHWLDRGEWKPTRVELDEYADGFAALEGQHKVLLRRSLRVQGAVEMAPDEATRLRATPMQILYRDRASGQVVVLGEVQDSTAARTGPATIVWPNAFNGLHADYRATYRAGSFECDVILRELPPSPSDLGLDPATTELQVLTEFYDTDAVVRSVKVSDTEQDIEIGVGPMQFGNGTAFGEDTETGSQHRESVRKEWVELDGRRFLIESVPLTGNQADMEALPREGAWNTRPRARPGLDISKRLVATSRRTSWRDSVASLTRSGTRQTAALNSAPRPGYVVDYIVEIGGSTNLSTVTFASTNTYYISGPVNLSGTVTFEPMTVIKYANTNNSGLTVQSSATLNWLGEPYRPVFMTAKDDNSVGATISGSSGTPTGTYASLALNLPRSSTTAGRSIRDLRIAFAKTALRFSSGSSKHLVRHAQFVKCDQGLTAKTSTVELQNVLMDNVKTNFADLDESAVSVYFATFDVGNKLNDYPTSGSSLSLYAVLCTAVTDTSGATFNGPGPLASNSGIYEVSASGRHYLPSASPYLGTAPQYTWYGIAPSELATDLASAPTSKSAPYTLSGGLSTPINFATDMRSFAPAGEETAQYIGYNYWRLDLVVSNLTLNSGGVLKVQPAIRTIGLIGDQPIICQGGAVTIEGTPDSRIRICRVASVQEDSTTATLSGSSFKLFGGPPISASFRFVDISFIPSENYNRRQLIDSSTAVDGMVSIRDSHLQAVNVEPYYVGYTTGFNLALNNNILEWTRVSCGQPSSGGSPPFNLQFYNNLVRLGSFSGSYKDGYYGTWNVRDNFFESSSVSCTTNVSPFPSSNNGFYQSTALPGSGNRAVTTLNWASGPLGSFYYPTGAGSGTLSDLINAGSRSAGAAGLYHYTTRSAQTKDGVDDSSKVDIGFHNVATASVSSTVAVDTDNDGLYDYMEDANGDGVLNSEESSIALADSDYDYLSDLVERQIGSNPRSNDTDGDSALDGDEYWNGTNPSASGDYPPAVVESIRMNSGTFASDNVLTPTYNSATTTNSYDGLAASFSNSGQRLVYPTTVVTGGITRPTIYFQNGSVRFTYIPDWYAGSVTNQPGSWLRLMECGSWRLTIDPSGTWLSFQTGLTNIASSTNLVVSLQKPVGPPGRVAWEIALSYTAKKSAISINGSTPVEGMGVEVPPSASEIAAGWCLGNSLGATNHCKGTIDNLETLNTAFLLGSANLPTKTLFDNAVRRAQIASASVVTNGIRLEWLRGWEGDWLTNSGLYSISRRSAGSSGAFSTIATDVRTNAWVDSTAVVGGYYEYRVGRHTANELRNIPTVVAARNGAVTDRRGRALILVDNVVSNAIATELEAYKNDLIADGWVLTVTNVPRHKDLRYLTQDYADYRNVALPTNRLNGEFIKRYITNWFDLAPGDTNAIVLIGHVTIPTSGYLPQDGHPDHRGAWPADVWYADRTGAWTDTNSYSTNGIYGFLYNYQNDGQFDQDSIPIEADGSPGRPEMSIGRIDFRMMADFSKGTETISDTNDVTEIRLLKQYLAKVARYRRGQIAAQEDVVAFIKNSSFMGMTPSVLRFGKRALGTEIIAPSRFFDDLFLTGSVTLFGVHGNYGNYDAFGNGQDSQQHTVFAIARETTNQVPRSLFSLFTGSYFGEWFNGSNLQGSDALRAAIAVTNMSLTATWMDVVPPYSKGFDWRTDRFLMGFHYGTALQDSFAAYPEVSCRHTVILGDPMLRASALPGVSSLSATKVGIKNLGYDVSVSWNGNTNATDGYRILWATSTTSPNWQFLADIKGTNWTHTTSNPSTNVYLVKALSSKITGTGVYTNCSLGAFSQTVIVP